MNLEGMLKAGTIMTTENGSKYKVEKLLGAGGQGEVYEVERDKKSYALKWYFKASATSAQNSILENLIAKGAPDATFLWPQDLILSQPGEPFGYIMELRPSNFKSIVDMMKRRAEPSFKALCRAAFNLTKGYEKLHAMGFSYRDISFGNLFFDPKNGDVLICDNDNVSAENNAGVYGTPRFMAPEIVVGKAKPSRNTDLYSLAVLLFYMFMMNHPLEGKLEADIKCMDVHAMNQLYGSKSLFIYDPSDKRNRPVKGYQDNALIYWDLYPQHLRDRFTDSFTTGLSQPSKRVTEKQWLDTFANLMFGIVPCQSCGAEVFFDEAKQSSGVAHTCWNCGKAIQMPLSIAVGKSRTLLMKETKLYAYQTQGDYDLKTVTGSVVQNPNNPNLWGIRNDTAGNWTYIKGDGTQVPVAPGKSAAIAKDAKIDFGQLTAEFK
jgi:serine/threonine protein kinase